MFQGITGFELRSVEKSGIGASGAVADSCETRPTCSITRLDQGPQEMQNAQGKQAAYDRIRIL
jgi:hypothetical protein